MPEVPEKDLQKIAKGWSIAMEYSKERLKRVHDLEDDQMENAINEGLLVLETTCLFMHACVKRGQYNLPLEFWRILHGEYGIVVYPSAFTEEVHVQGMDTEITFTEAYQGHIVMFPRCDSSIKHCPRCPFEFLREPPPVYTKRWDPEPPRTTE